MLNLPTKVYFVLPITPPIFVPDDGGGFIDMDKAPIEGESWGEVWYDIFSGIGDFFGDVSNAVVEIADFAVKAFEGALDLIGKVTDFLPSFDFLADLLPYGAGEMASAILAIVAAVITFKIVSVFA